MRYEFIHRPADASERWWSGWVETSDGVVVTASPSCNRYLGKDIDEVLIHMYYRPATVRVSQYKRGPSCVISR